jgi:hypothetical protein
MAAPKTLVRRGGLVAWLETHGFTKHQVNGLIDAGVLDAAKVHIAHRRRGEKPASRSKTVPAADDQTPAMINGRAFYRTLKVAELLRLTL